MCGYVSSSVGDGDVVEKVGFVGEKHTAGLMDCGAVLRVATRISCSISIYD